MAHAVDATCAELRGIALERQQDDDEVADKFKLWHAMVVIRSLLKSVSKTLLLLMP